MKPLFLITLLSCLLSACGTLRQEGQREPVWPYPEPPVVDDADQTPARRQSPAPWEQPAEPRPIDPEPWEEATPIPAPERPAFTGPRNLRDQAGPAALALADQAATQRAQGDLSGAAAQLERALRIEPRNPFLWLLLGQIHLEQSDPEQARQMARRARSLASGNPYVDAPAWRIAEAAWRVEGNTQQAEESARAAEQAELSQT
ncbi:MAG: tetratricopeptide repeat protein [Pseudomonadota bacterium]|nr:tetratricopeptide repeat protein [Pseudomonadota bacterium]